MAVDDLVNDAALVTRLVNITESLDDLAGLVAMRSHLPQNLGMLVEASKALATEMGAVAQPDDPVNAKYRSRMRNEFCTFISGSRFYLYDPKPEEVSHEDLLLGLLNCARWAGQTSRRISVMEHSIKVAAIVEHLVMLEVQEGNLHHDVVPVANLHALLHDAHEYVTGDIPAPYKTRLCDSFGTPWSRTEQAIQDAILDAYALPPIPAEVATIIHQADLWMRYCECVALRPHLMDTMGKRLQVPPDDVMHIGSVKKEEPPRDVVMGLFDGEIRRLISLVGGVIPGKATRYLAAAPAPVSPMKTPHDNVPMSVAGARDPQQQAALEQLARAANANVPGSRPNPPPPPENQGSGFIPQLSRDPGPSDVRQKSWMQAQRSAEVQVPPELMNEPEFRSAPEGAGGDPSGS